MNNTVMRVIDVLGVALVLGLILRYGQEATQLTNAFGANVTGIYNAAALTYAPAPPTRGNG